MNKKQSFLFTFQAIALQEDYFRSPRIPTVQRYLDEPHSQVKIIAGIAYGARGELRHLPLNESDLRYVELLRALKDTGAKGMVICESPNLEEDALLLKESYLSLAGKD